MSDYRRSYGWLGILVFVIGLAWFAGTIPGVLRSAHSNDFKHIYLGMRAVMQGYEPYSPESLFAQANQAGMGDVDLNPYVYLPFTGLAMGFLYPLSFTRAENAWFALNCLMLIATLLLYLPAVFPYRGALAVGIGLLAMSLNHPFIRTLTAGQLNVVLLLCIAASFVLLARGRLVTAGIILGFAAVFKLAPAAFLLYFALRRQWRALLSMVIAITAFMLVSIAIVGWQPHAEFIPMLRQMSYGRSTWQEYNAIFWKDPTNQSPNSLLTHLLVAENSITRPWIAASQSAANLATWVFSLALLAIYAASLWRERGRAPGAGFQATVVLMLLLPSLMWDHYLVMLLLPVAWLVNRYSIQRRYGLLSVAIISFVVSSLPWPYAAPQFQSGWRVLLMSLKLFPTITIFLLACGEAIRSKTVESEASPLHQQVTPSEVRTIENSQESA